MMDYRILGGSVDRIFLALCFIARFVYEPVRGLPTFEVICASIPIA